MNKQETPKEVKKVEEKKQETPKEVKKVEEKKVIVKDKATAFGSSLRISPKNSMAICKVIKGKSPQDAIKRLEDVIKMKRVIPMTGREIPHKKGKGIAGASYPINAAKEIIGLLKQVNSNAIVNGIEDPIISFAVANIGSRPFRRGGTRGKRTHLKIEVISKTKLAEKKK